VISGKDNIPHQIYDGYRYQHFLRFKEDIEQRIGKRKAEEGETAPPKKRAKRLAGVYLVIREHFHSTATDEEKKMELDLNNLDHNSHRIIQCKTR
jgi:hypothetical protein